MRELEAGAIANPDEQRMVGHYWLRAPEKAPNEEIRNAISAAYADILSFADAVHGGKITPQSGGKFSDALLIGVFAVIAAIVAGYPTVALLRRLKVGKQISQWGPESHIAKAGTPTIGGVLVVAVVALATLAFNFFGRYSIAGPMGVMAPLAALGFLDDLGSLQGRPQRALTRRIKLLAFLATGAAAAYGLYELLDLTAINIPYDGRHDIGLLYLPLVLGVVVLTAGGVAVTDGLDGLVAGTAALAYSGYGTIALLHPDPDGAVKPLMAAGAARVLTIQPSEGLVVESEY